ncbi:MAG: aminotransferase class IV [Terriglobia bacterium]
MNAAAGWAWADGQVMPLAEATVPLSDPGFLLGDGVFETLRARHGKIFAWPRHRERMAHGLDVLGIEPTVLARVDSALVALTEAAASTFDDMYVRVQVVRAPGAGMTTGTVTALARACPDYPAHWYEQGVRLGVTELRCDPEAPLAGVKSLSYLPQVLARRHAQTRGFDDALMLNTMGRVCESAHGNIIARLGRTLYAPGREEGALGGVTRGALLRWADEHDYIIEIRLPWEVLSEVEEAVLVSTLAGVVPVASVEGIDTHLVAGSGELAIAMRQAYEDLLNGLQ